VAHVDTSDKLFTLNGETTTTTDASGKPVTVEEQQEKQITRQLTAFKKGLDTGTNVVTNNKAELTVMQMKVDLEQIMHSDSVIEDKIIAYFGVPKFLVNRSDVNRATAETSMGAFGEMTCKPFQRIIKRDLETFWYDMLTRHILTKYGMLTSELGELPVRVKHSWRPFDMGSLGEKSDVAMRLYDKGLGILGDNPAVAMQVAKLDTQEVMDCLSTSSELDDKQVLEKQDKQDRSG
jgi:hypothetical protein